MATVLLLAACAASSSPSTESASSEMCVEADPDDAGGPDWEAEYQNDLASCRGLVPSCEGGRSTLDLPSPVAHASATSLDFGLADCGSTGAARTVTLQGPASGQILSHEAFAITIVPLVPATADAALPVSGTLQLQTHDPTHPTLWTLDVVNDWVLSKVAMQGIPSAKKVVSGGGSQISAGACILRKEGAIDCMQDPRFGAFDVPGFF